MLRLGWDIAWYNLDRSTLNLWCPEIWSWKEILFTSERKLAASGMLPSMLFSPLALGKAKWLLEKVVGNSFGTCFSWPAQGHLHLLWKVGFMREWKALQDPPRAMVKARLIMLMARPIYTISVENRLDGELVNHGKPVFSFGACWSLICPRLVLRRRKNGDEMTVFVWRMLW